MKKLTCLLLSVYLLLVGYTFPDNTPYVVVECNLGNNYPIHFRENLTQYLYVSDTNIISSYSTTIYGYGPGDQRISFGTYFEPTYVNGYNTVNLGITKVKENHLYDTTSRRVNLNYQYITIGLLGAMIVVIFFKGGRS